MNAQKTWAILIGVVLTIVAIWGYIDGSEVLGFAVDGIHSTVHLITGLIFLWAGWKGNPMPVNKWLGVVYILVAVLGFPGWLDSIMAINSADHWLHLVIGVVSAGIGWFVK